MVVDAMAGRESSMLIYNFMIPKYSNELHVCIYFGVVGWYP